MSNNHSTIITSNSIWLRAVRTVLWVGLYVFIVISPLLLAVLMDSAPSRSWVTEFSVALGFIALMIFFLQFVLIARWKSIPQLGMDLLIQYHKQMTFVALVFVLAHPILLFIEGPSKLGLLNFMDAPHRARFGLLALVALFFIILISVFRKQLRLSYEAWQFLHILFAILVVSMSMGHIVLVNFYLGDSAQQLLWLMLSIGVISIIVWMHFVMPILRFRHPWVVSAVHMERTPGPHRMIEGVPDVRDPAWTLTITPDGHPGFKFKPGQFAYLIIKHSPFSINQHPFSISSSSDHMDKHRISFTIKSIGDFTSTIRHLKPGTRVYVDGPYGLFTLNHARYKKGLVVIAGGIGITPFISMLRTMAERHDTRTVILIYGNEDAKSVIFREELERLEGLLNLRIVHVLHQAPKGWGGETGFVTRDVLSRSLPANYLRLQYFVCGPPIMTNSVEEALGSLGIPASQIATERFELV